MSGRKKEEGCCPFLSFRDTSEYEIATAAGVPGFSAKPKDTSPLIRSQPGVAKVYNTASIAAAEIQASGNKNSGKEQAPATPV